MQQEMMSFETDWISYSKNYESSKLGGIFDLSNWGVIQISGPDALAYLQRMSTAQLKNLEIGNAMPGAFLTGKGALVVWGDFYRMDELSYLFVLSPGQVAPAMEHLEMFHFQEKLELIDQSQLWSLVGLWNTSFKIKEPHWLDFKRKALQFVLLPRENYQKCLKDWLEQGLSLLGMPLFHFFRVLYGIPWMGWEVRAGDLILEAGLEAIVARNKGCYPGQEVVERIFTYGQVNRKLLKVELKKAEQIHWPEIPKEITINEEIVGQLLSVIPTPSDSSDAIGLAMIKKAFWEEKRRFEIGPEKLMSLSLSEMATK